jgi:transposase
MAKSPHTPEFRAKVSQEYLDVSPYPFLAKKYNIGKNSFLMCRQNILVLKTNK